MRVLNYVFEQEALRAPQPVWTVLEQRKSAAHGGIGSTDRPARTEPLCRLSYPRS